MKRFICMLHGERPETQAKFQHLSVQELRQVYPVRIFWARDEVDARCHFYRLIWHEVMVTIDADDISVSEHIL